MSLYVLITLSIGKNENEVINIGISILVLFIAVPIAIYSSYRQLKTWDDRYEPVESIDLEFQKTESPIEIRLLKALRINGYYPRTQVPCGKFRIDIAFPVQKLAIECDGAAFHSTPKQKAHDRKKDTFLRKHGWKVLRFTGSQINGRMGYCLKRIEGELRKRQVLF
ncbi:endonuclease domain-containing protein [Evansella tamaricis]|uniref:DUF559 domain-containing protein n=1 Tax=Evansella tamaricis TaxID=2069301 RepID=A0ABS6JL56_9BACI|nr:DUF559 domain-containing protein [Evansella tamaricis]MBU9714409.1 DUF559 domain-containing protein [Evansella tamaricis]